MNNIKYVTNIIRNNTRVQMNPLIKRFNLCSWILCGPRFFNLGAQVPLGGELCIEPRSLCAVPDEVCAGQVLQEGGGVETLQQKCFSSCWLLQEDLTDGNGQ